MDGHNAGISKLASRAIVYPIALFFQCFVNKTKNTFGGLPKPLSFLAVSFTLPDHFFYPLRQPLLPSIIALPQLDSVAQPPRDDCAL